MTILFPDAPAVGESFDRWTWDGDKWAPRFEPPPMPTGGRMMQVDFLSPGITNSLRFMPYRGSHVRINGDIFTVPDTGIFASFANIYVNGVPGQTLAPSTFYYVYLFNNNGVPTFDYWTGPNAGHEFSTQPDNMGTEIRIGDDTRTLIGIAYTHVDQSFLNLPSARHVRSWFNRSSETVYLRADTWTWPAGPWDVASGSFVSFDETMLISSFGTYASDLPGGGTQTWIYSLLDGAAASSAAIGHQIAGYFAGASSAAVDITEGRHTTGIRLGITAGNSTGGSQLSGMYG